MNFLKKLFGYSSNGTYIQNGLATSAETVAPESSDAPQDFQNYGTVDEDVFRDNSAPEKLPVAASEESVLSSFLGQDFSGNGFNDGYDYASPDVLSNSLAQIKSTFRHCLDRMIDTYNSEIVKMQESIIRLEGLDSTAPRELESRIAELRKMISRMLNEKELSADGKGMIESPESQYRAGFSKGVAAKAEEKLLKIPCGLF